MTSFQQSKQSDNMPCIVEGEILHIETLTVFLLPKSSHNYSLTTLTFLPWHLLCKMIISWATCGSNSLAFHPTVVLIFLTKWDLVDSLRDITKHHIETKYYLTWTACWIILGCASSESFIVVGVLCHTVHCTLPWSFYITSIVQRSFPHHVWFIDHW